MLDGSNAGSASGLLFEQISPNNSSVKGLTIRNFQKWGIALDPVNANERTTIDGCHIYYCDYGGVVMADGDFHAIFNSTIESNSGWGVIITNPSLEGVQVSNCTIKSNSIGGIQLVGTEHQVQGCLINRNGSAETSSTDHRGGVVFGSSTGSAVRCRTENCTLALNNPWGAKRLSGSDGDIRKNETYLNTQSGIKVLGSQPVVKPWAFVVDDVNDQIIISVQVTANANQSVEVEFFVPIEPAPNNQGAAYLNGADRTVSLDGSGTAYTFHKFSSTGYVFDALAIEPPISPVPFFINETDSIVATATAYLGARTSEFSERAQATLPGDFDLDGYGTGHDFLIWQRNLGSTDAEYWEGDADFDGDVDGTDLDIMEANFP